MRAVIVEPSDDGGTLRLVDVPAPEPAAGEIVIDVAAAGVNRADVVQRRGRYAPPPDASAVPGLECAGVVSAVGAQVEGWQVGDRVCALLAGGGYAERVTVPVGQVFAVPRSLDLVSAAALPEALATVWSNLTQRGRLVAGETLLVHGGASGIGTTAIQVAALLGARVFATAGGDRKLARCRQLGVELAIDYKSDDFVDQVRKATGGQGVDVVLDIVGADYVQANIDVLAPEGRLVVIGLQSGDRAVVDLRAVLTKRVVLTGSLLRSRSIDDKAAIISEVVRHVIPAVERGEVIPVIDSVHPLEDAMAAHRRMESSRHIGKILLTP